MKAIFSLFLLLLLAAIWHPVKSQTDSVRMFVFGHSLIDYRPPAIPTPSDETTVLHWMYLMAQDAGKDFAGGGKYGFLPQHDDLPPFSQWGYELVPGVWESDTEAFSEANINTILITAGNFIQYQAAHLPHPIDESTTVLKSTESIFDWVAEQVSGLRYYIYSNWPEMDLQSAYPPTLPTQVEVDAYHTQTIGPFTDWWISYQDSLLVSRPQYQVRLIPVGQIISKILRDQLSYQVPFDEVYEDSDPHGRANLYFLAGMISYMAVFEEQIPATFDPGTIIHPIIRDSLAQIQAFIWEELMQFNGPDGKSRVFFSEMTTNRKEVEVPLLSLIPNPGKGLVKLTGEINIDKIKVYDRTGRFFLTFGEYTPGDILDISHLPKGIYMLRIHSDSYPGIFYKKLILLP